MNVVEYDPQTEIGSYWAYQNHLAACTVCRPKRGELCQGGTMLHDVWRGYVDEQLRAAASMADARRIREYRTKQAQAR